VRALPALATRHAPSTFLCKGWVVHAPGRGGSVSLPMVCAPQRLTPTRRVAHKRQCPYSSWRPARMLFPADWLSSSASRSKPRPVGHMYRQHQQPSATVRLMVRYAAGCWCAARRQETRIAGAIVLRLISCANTPPSSTVTKIRLRSTMKSSTDTCWSSSATTNELKLEPQRHAGIPQRRKFHPRYLLALSSWSAPLVWSSRRVPHGG
jgi:hypothetical protein